MYSSIKIMDLNELKERFPATTDSLKNAEFQYGHSFLAGNAANPFKDTFDMSKAKNNLDNTVSNVKSIGLEIANTVTDVKNLAINTGLNVVENAKIAGNALYSNAINSAYAVIDNAGATLIDAGTEIYNNVEDTIKLASDLPKIIADDMTKYIRNVVSYCTAQLSDMMVSFPKDVTSYAAEYAMVEVKEHEKMSLSMFTTNHEQSMISNIGDSISELTGDITNSITAGIADLTRFMNDKIELVNVGKDFITSYINLGPDIVVKKINEYESYIMESVSGYVNTYMNHLRQLKENAVNNIGTATGKKIANTSIAALDKLNRETTNKANVITARAKIKGKIAVKKALLKVLAALGG